MSQAARWDAAAAHHAAAAERIATAVVTGAVKISDVREDLALHLRAAEVNRQASALARFRAGEPVLAWPATAPWSGF